MHALSHQGQHGRVAASSVLQGRSSSDSSAGTGCSNCTRKRTHNRKTNHNQNKANRTAGVITTAIKSVVVAAALALMIGWIELATTIQRIPPQHWLLQQQQQLHQQQLQAPPPPTNAPKTIMSIPRNVCWIPHVSGSTESSRMISGCIEEVTADVELFTIPHCSFQRVILDRSKLKWRALGGEALDTVMGQPEEDEYVTYAQGALVVYSDTATTSNAAATITSPWIEESLYQHNASRLARRDKSLLYLKDVLDSVTFVQPPLSSLDAAQSEWNRVCGSAMGEMTTSTTTLLLIQRYDYVNLYHTMTDIWNTWEVYRQLVPSAQAGDNDNDNANTTTIQVVFWDAHPSGMLDEIWTRLFGTAVQPIHAFLQQHHSHSNITCCDSVHLIPSGFTSRLTHDVQCVDPTVMNDFVQFVHIDCRSQTSRGASSQ